MDKKDKEIYYIRESAVQSIISDAVMYGGIIGLLYFNHSVLNGNAFIDFLFILFMLLSATARGSKKMLKFNTPQEVVDYIKKNAERPASEK